MDALVLASPDAAIAAVPHLLGFTPSQSLVFAWSRDDRLLLTQRMDIGEEPSQAWLHEAVRHGAGAGATAVVVIAFRARGAREALPGRGLVDALERRLAIAGVELIDALLVDEGLWWSYRCDDPCCPPQGRAVDASVAAEITAEFVLQGSAPFPSRLALEDSLRAEPDDVLVPEPRPSDLPLEQWRDAMLAGPVTHLISGAPLATIDERQLVTALADIRIRDTLLWRLTAGSRPRVVMPALTAVMRRAPVGHVAPVATVLAITAWLCGDGARGSVAVERALVDDPEYSLALLVDGSLRSGLAPEAWVRAMRGLSERDCRHGSLPRDGS